MDQTFIHSRTKARARHIVASEKGAADRGGRAIRGAWVGFLVCLFWDCGDCWMCKSESELRDLNLRSENEI